MTTEITKNEAFAALEGVLKTYPELIKNLYADGASNAIQEVGGLVTDLVKTARLITLPIQYAAHLQDRLTKHFRKVASAIPVERQTTPPTVLLLPLLDKLQYQADDDLLTSLYIELLKRACDKDRADEAHPAFINIIPQLSTDEALIVFHLFGNGRNPGKYFLAEQKGSQNRLMNHTTVIQLNQPSSTPKGYTLRSSAVVKNLFSLQDLVQPKYIDMYASHLKSLNLIQLRTSPGLVQLHLTEDDVACNRLHKKDIVWYDLTLFGELFAKACISPDFKLPV